MSLSKALTMLGIPTIHNPHDEVTERELRQGNYRLAVCTRYQGVVDIPVAPYFPQLDTAYPQSKFILTVRDVESWLASVQKHWQWQEQAGRDSFVEFIHAAVYGAIEFNEERYRYVFDTHRRNIEHYFRERPDDLLVIDIPAGDAWESLCPFLGVPVPNAPFPHANTRDDIAHWARMIEAARHDVEEAISSRSRVVLVDEGRLGGTIVNERRAWPFLERDGTYFGPPSDSAAAIESLETLRQRGAEYLIFAWPAFWWLDHYEAFREHLDARFPCVRKTDAVVVFDMRSGRQ